ncbi:unnamed protein product [Prunus brigantina]
MTRHAILTNDHTQMDINDKPGTSRVHISTISRGSTLVGNSNRAIKSYAQTYQRGMTEVMSVRSAERPPKSPKLECE